jgi:hypothetical protein
MTIILQPLSSDVAIPYPKRLTEFEIQSRVYTSLRAMGYDARGEIVWQRITNSSGKTKREKCRFDVLIFEDKKVVEIVEIKNSVKSNRGNLETTRQGTRYRRFGVPVVFIHGDTDATNYLNTKISS